MCYSLSLESCDQNTSTFAYVVQCSTRSCPYFSFHEENVDLLML